MSLTYLDDPAANLRAVIGNVTTAPTGMYRSIKFAKYAYRNLSEVQFRFNRRSEMCAMLDSLLRPLVSSPKQPERDIRVAVIHRQSGPVKW